MLEKKVYSINELVQGQILQLITYMDKSDNSVYFQQGLTSDGKKIIFLIHKENYVDLGKLKTNGSRCVWNAKITGISDKGYKMLVFVSLPGTEPSSLIPYSAGGYTVGQIVQVKVGTSKDEERFIFPLTEGKKKIFFLINRTKAEQVQKLDNACFGDKIAYIPF